MPEARFISESRPLRRKLERSPFKRLAYIYVGTTDYEADHRFYKDVLGASLVWEFKEFGARVAAFDLAGEPYLLLADHVKTPSKRLIFEVEDLGSAANQLKARGWKPDGGKFEIPDGPCINFEDESGERVRHTPDEEAQDT